MMRPSRPGHLLAPTTRLSSAAMAVSAVTVLSACASSSRASGPAMMGANRAGRQSVPSSMMGGGSAYHYSSLTC